MDNYLKIGEAAEKLGVSTETLRRWDKSGKFPSERHPINNYRVYKEKKIDNFMSDAQVEFKKEKTKEIDEDPFFKTEFGKLFNLDAIDFLKSMESESVDLIFADPPYNIKKAEWDTFESQKEYVEWSIEWIKEAKRVLKDNGSLYVCGFSEIIADIKWAASDMFKGCKWLVWYYRNKANLGKDWGRAHESIIHFRKSKKFTFNIDNVRIPYNAHTLKYPKRTQSKSSQYDNGDGKKYQWEPHPLGAKPKDVFEIPTLSNGSWERVDKHPTQKPVELVKKFVLGSANEGDLIYDPFGGTGTTYAVAEAFERRWVGTEINKDFCDLIKNRVTDKNHIDRIASEKDEKESRERRKKIRDLFE
ncbi:DNA methyltransferase [Fodinibius halophilus]|uniref:Methyltransferase n=1 Tax=Fodinibius halophilus TaxID=1736908 RepID=A0A6M1T9N7_9BACT|nr:DNA methyltransferase [Fodinibius halophilus]NGP87072.1 MerR family DNA-binding transcriptional regulator [Fodinibius halophilus]